MNARREIYTSYPLLMIFTLELIFEKYTDLKQMWWNLKLYKTAVKNYLFIYFSV